MPLPIKDY